MPAGICKLGLLLALLWFGYSGVMNGKEQIMRGMDEFCVERGHSENGRINTMFETMLRCKHNACLEAS
jgi:hypothetical protein